EVDIVQAADTTILVLTPGQGDAVQAFKAGIMEIADVFCVNKSDLPGADRLKREIAAAMELGAYPEDAWRPPIVGAVASKGEGVAEVLDQVDAHRAHLHAQGALASAGRRRVRAEVVAILGEQLRKALVEREDEAVDAILEGHVTPAEVVHRLLA